MNRDPVIEKYQKCYLKIEQRQVGNYEKKNHHNELDGNIQLEGEVSLVRGGVRDLVRPGMLISSQNKHTGE